MREPKYCNSCYCPLYSSSSEISIDMPFSKSLRNARFRFIQCSAPWLIPLVRPAVGDHGKTVPRNNEIEYFEPGDWVEVLSEAEIESKLSKSGRTRGLLFMPEMRRFYGQRLKVFKRVDKILLEATGELRKMNSPVLYLEGAFCDGAFHHGCERSCFLMWREEWLKRVPSPVKE